MQPDDAGAHNNLGHALQAKGLPDDATAAYLKALSLRHNYAKAWNNLAAARSACGDALGAETALRRAIESDGSLAVARSNLGRLLLESGRVPEALDVLARALSDGQGDPDTRLALARCHVQTGDLERGEATLVDAVKASPSSADLWEALGDLRRRRGAFEPALDAYEAAGAAVADTGSDARSRVARRRALAALECARTGVEAGSGAKFVRFSMRLREALADAGPDASADPALADARSRCGAAAESGGLSAAWVNEVLSGAFRGERARPGTNGSAAPR